MQFYENDRSPNNVRKQCKGDVKYRNTNQIMQNLINGLVNLRTIIFISESFHVIKNYSFEIVSMS